mmetsp:Transcript_28245/g.86559  ORF Transcript_28245/g.86559 Transcript_28245/m.86559 type:complete len:299 (-) Transcript_28245:1391-2287(-)
MGAGAARCYCWRCSPALRRRRRRLRRGRAAAPLPPSRDARRPPRQVSGPRRAQVPRRRHRRRGAHCGQPRVRRHALSLAPRPPAHRPPLQRRRGRRWSSSHCAPRLRQERGVSGPVHRWCCERQRHEQQQQSRCRREQRRWRRRVLRRLILLRRRQGGQEQQQQQHRQEEDRRRQRRREQSAFFIVGDSEKLVDFFFFFVEAAVKDAATKLAYAADGGAAGTVGELRGAAVRGQARQGRGPAPRVAVAGPHDPQGVPWSLRRPRRADAHDAGPRRRARRRAGHGAPVPRQGRQGPRPR